MRCKKCGQTAWVELRRHNAGFCRDHFLEYFEGQVEKAISEHRMFEPDDRILVAVSGGKDSLVLWDVLLRRGYQADGLYIGLGIGEYSSLSSEKVGRFAAERGARLVRVDLPQEGGGVEEVARRTRRPACSACGLSKRYLFNQQALAGGYDVLATGHNLDDEAATLLGNVLNWQTGYLARQSPVLPATHPRLVKKVKPLYRLTERETASYAVLRGIDYVVEECPHSVGARSLLLKDVLNRLERESPGTKHQFLFGFLAKGRALFARADETDLRGCVRCGQPTTAQVCAFCRLQERASLTVAGV